MQCAVQNDFRVVRICQADALKNQSFWKERLYKAVVEDHRRVMMLADDANVYNEHWRLADIV